MYLKYKNKYLELKEQNGGTVILNYFRYFYNVTTYDTLNKILRPILYDYWAEISKCYRLINPADFDYNSAIKHPTSPNLALHRKSIAVFLSDHSPVHSSVNSIITWNVGISDDEDLFNYLTPFRFNDITYSFTKPHDRSILVTLKARLITEYIKFYKTTNTIVNLQECSSELYTLIHANFASEYFSSNFLPQTLVTLPMDLDISHSISYYKMAPKDYNKSGLCSFAFFPDKASIREIKLIPSIISVFKFTRSIPNIYNMTCRACKIVGLDSSNTYYNVHLDGSVASSDTRTLLKNGPYIFQVVNAETSAVYNKFVEIITTNLGSSDLFKITTNVIFGSSDTMPLSADNKIIIAGDFNNKWNENIDKNSKGVTDKNFYSKTNYQAYKIDSDSNIDYILSFSV